MVVAMPIGNVGKTHAARSVQSSRSHQRFGRRSERLAARGARAAVRPGAAGRCADGAYPERYWAAGDVDRTHALAKELVSSAPDVIVVNTPPGLSALRLETHTIPIIFVQVLDASESTVVMNPARPESNITGFTNFYEYGVSSKW